MAFELDGADEFLVNFETTDDQETPNIAVLPDGRVIVAWQTGDAAQDGDGDAIKARIFDAAGSPVVPEFLVNTQATDDQFQVSLGAFADGRFVAIWGTFDVTQDGSASAIKGQLFNTEGAPLGGEFLVNDQATLNQLEGMVTVLADGRFVVTWATTDPTQDGDGPATKARLFNGDGTAVDGEFLVNTTGTTGAQIAPAAAAGNDGGFLAAWTTSDSSQDGDDQAIKARLFDSDGTAVTDEFVVNAEKAADQDNPVVTALSDGRFVIAWETEDPAQDGDARALKARIINADGSFAGGEFLVNTEGTDEQKTPVVTALSGGRFAIAWKTEDPLQDGSGDAIKMRVFEADGTATTGEIVANVETTGDQLTPAIATLADGRIIVTWTTFDASQDGDGFAVKARIFELVNRETGTGADEVFLGTSERDEFDGMGGNDLLFGKQGDDDLDGGRGKDQAFGGRGDDTILGGKGKDDLNGGKGDDTIFGEEGKDTLNGNRGNDTLNGGDDKDLICGGDDDDTLLGGDGRDTLKGEDGDDTLTGGRGKDKFVLRPDGSFDLITDFKNGKDKIDLSAFGFGSKAKALKKFYEAGTADDDQIVFAHKGTAAEINGIDMGQLGGGDLII